MNAIEQWRSYFYPETWDENTGAGTLKNRFGERDASRLRSKEYRATEARIGDLRSGLDDVARTYDAEHVKALHRHIFQDVYDWAGEYRTVDMAKGAAGGFAQVHPRAGESASPVAQELETVAAIVRGADWTEMDKGSFAQAMAEVYAHLNHAHPFREGNGRSGKMFIEHVAELSPYSLDFSAVSPGEWNAASDLSRPQTRDLHNMRGIDPAPLVDVFERMATQRSDEPPRTPGVTSHAQERARAGPERDQHSRTVSARERIFGSTGKSAPDNSESYQSRTRRHSAERHPRRDGRGREA